MYSSATRSSSASGLRGGGLLVGLGLGVGEGEGDVAAETIAAPRWNSSAKMNGRDLMELRRAHLRRRFARCQKFPHERSSSSLRKGILAMKRRLLFSTFACLI